MFLDNLHKVAITFNEVPIFHQRVLNSTIRNTEYKNMERYAYAVGAYATYFNYIGTDQ